MRLPPSSDSTRFSARTAWTLSQRALSTIGLMLSGIGVAFVRDLAAIDSVLQHEIEGAAGELVTAIGSPVREGAAFAADTRSIEFCLKSTHRSKFDVTPKYMEDGVEPPLH